MSNGLKVEEKFNFALAVLYSVAKDEECQEVRELFACAMQFILDANRIKMGLEPEKREADTE